MKVKTHVRESLLEGWSVSRQMGRRRKHRRRRDPGGSWSVLLGVSDCLLVSSTCSMVPEAALCSGYHLLPEVPD